MKVNLSKLYDINDFNYLDDFDKAQKMNVKEKRIFKKSFLLKSKTKPKYKDKHNILNLNNFPI